MPNVNDVIKGLERCQVAGCDECKQPDKSGYPWDCESFDRMVNESIALLKAQEPRVMTIDELRKLQKQDVVWLENVDKEAIIPGIVITALKKEWQFMTFTGCSGLFCVSCVDYGKRWRCWTQKPTDEQAEVEPWE